MKFWLLRLYICKASEEKTNEAYKKGKNVNHSSFHKLMGFDTFLIGFKENKVLINTAFMHL